MSLSAQEQNYLVKFCDKGPADQLRVNELSSLSPDAIERRKARAIPIDELDFPVHKEYVESIRSLGIQVKAKTRWFNGV